MGAILLAIDVHKDTSNYLINAKLKALSQLVCINKNQITLNNVIKVEFLY